MNPKQMAMAGSLESSDVLVTLEPSESAGIEIDLSSPVEKIFGPGILSLVRESLCELGVENAKVRVQDHGALDFVIKARVQAAFLRSVHEQENARALGFILYPAGGH